MRIKEASYNTIKEELESAICEYMEENELDFSSDIDVHRAKDDVVNDDWYMIGYYQCDQWLIKHDVTVWEAIAFVMEYEKEHYGASRVYTNSEDTVNMIAYIIGQDVDIKKPA